MFKFIYHNYTCSFIGKNYVIYKTSDIIIMSEVFLLQINNYMESIT